MASDEKQVSPVVPVHHVDRLTHALKRHRRHLHVAAAVSEEIADVMQASAEGFGSNEQIFPPSAAFVAKARVKGMDGYEATRRLQQEYGAACAPIVAVTALALAMIYAVVVVSDAERSIPIAYARAVLNAAIDTPLNRAPQLGKPRLKG